MRAWVAAVACGVLVSCGGSGGSATGGAGGQRPGSGGGPGGAATGGSSAAGAGGSTVDGGAGGAAGASGGTSGGAGMMTLRVAHGFLPLGATTGPTVDIYDDMYNTGLQVSVSGKPIISGLAYGTMSSYVKPRFVDMQGTAVLLTALPAGSPPDDLADAWIFWSGTDDGSHPQVTVLIYPTSSTMRGSPLDGLGTTAFFEKGDDTFTGNMGPLAPAPPSGQGEYLVATESIEPLEDFLNAGNEQYYFFVDDSCTPALNGDTSTPIAPLIWAAVGPTSEFSDFAAAPGTHNVSVAPWGDATSPTCDQLLPLRQGTTPLAVAAGEQIMVFVDGSSLSDLHLLTGPIAP